MKMNKKRKWALIVSIALGLAVQAQADIIYNATITGLIVPAGAANVATVRFTTTENKCTHNRIKFDKSNNELYSYILASQMAEKAVGFYFEPNGSALGGVYGHNVGTCELINLWQVGG